MNEVVNKGLRVARRIVVAVIGITLLLIGLALLVLPGPAMVVIPAGLAVLGTEFLWARRLLRKARTVVEQVMEKATDGRNSKDNDA